MRLLQCVIAITLSTVLLTAGQTGKIAGRVTDSGSGEPLVGCNVLISGTSSGAATDANGEYFIINLTPGSYDVEFSMIGYASYTSEGVSVNIDVTTPVDAALTTEAVELAGVSVIAERPAIENTLTSSKQIVSGDMMAAMAITDVNDVVKTLPGVTEFGGELHIRGGRSGEEMYLVDGASVTNTVFGGNAIPVNPSMVGELQLITGTFNAEYGQAMSGLFNTVLRVPTPGFHASLGFRTSLNQGHFTADKGDFQGKNVYAEAEIMNVVDDAGNYTTAVEGTDYTKGAYGEKKTIMDFSAGFGADPFGAYFSLRTLDDPGRLPGLAKDLMSMQAKVNYQLGGNLKLSAETMIISRNSFYDPTYDAERMDAGMDVWQWVMALDRYPRTEENTTQFGITANYVMSSSTNINVRLDMMMSTQEDGAKSSDGKFVDFVNNKQVTANSMYNGAEGPNHTKVMEHGAAANAWYSLENVYGHYFKSENTTTTIGVHATNQYNNRHLLKAGFDYRMYNIDRSGHDVWYGRTLGFTEANPRLQQNSFGDAKPTEIAAYVQDQMEFSDMILNLGLRFDGFNAGSDKGYWATDTDDMAADQALNPFDPSKRKATDMKTQISPRLGVSFPLGDDMAFRYSYGSFFERPFYYRLLNNHMAQMDGGTESGFFIYLGNANLDPKKTSKYEMGLQYSVSDNLKLDVAGYYKDISNLAASQEVYAVPYQDDGTGHDNEAGWGTDDTFEAAHYSFMVSDHYGNIRGLEMSLSQAGQSGLTGRASYTYSIARGTASEARNAGNGSLTQETGNVAADIMTMTTLNWHRPHMLNGFVDYHINVGGMVERAGLNMTFNIQSGLPVSARSGVGSTNLSERAPATTDINLKLDATLALGSVNPTVYLLVENALNIQNVVYIADPGSYFDDASNYYNVAAGPTNNLLAYGRPMTLNIGVQLDF
ncbi:MAG TPA: TonB-dependent receptor [Candidatus Marinimicrobia bacterium]|nr:TonB-dependent receptor [Candidatus Neomarinimicrobiota bacterium]